jgi:hypothetical protein
MAFARRSVHPDLELILIRHVNQYYLTPESARAQFCAFMSQEFNHRQCDLHIPAPSPEVLRSWFTQHIQVHSTAFLAGKFIELYQLIAGLASKLTLIQNEIILCEQKGLLIRNQSQVLFNVNEYLEFFGSHILTDPQPSEPRVLLSRSVSKVKLQNARFEAAEDLREFERSIAVDKQNQRRRIVRCDEMRDPRPESGTAEEDRDAINGDDDRVSEKAEKEGISDEDDSDEGNRRNRGVGNSVQSPPSEESDAHDSDTDDSHRRSCDMGDEVLDSPDSSESWDSPDDNESHVAWNLKPTPNVLFVLSLLSEGLAYAPAHRFLTKIRVRHCSERQFYRIQKALVPWLHMQGKTSCATALKQVGADEYIGFDGAWNHNRRGSKLIGTLCNISKRSVVGYSIIEKRSRLSEPFEGPSKQMEAKSFHELLTTLTYPALKFAGLVTDGDVSIRKIIRNETNIRHLLDIGHSVKSFIRYFHVTDKKNGGILGPFRDRLLVWFRHLVSQNLPLDEKKELWQNAVSHFRGDHSRCRHSASTKGRVIRDDETVLIEAMTTFLSSTTKYFELLEPNVRTQVNESLNAKRTRFASKNFAWGDSWVARMALAVMHFNDPYVYFTELVQKIGFGLPDAYYQSLDELFNQYIRTRQHPTGKRTRNLPTGNRSGPGPDDACLAPHLLPVTIGRPASERDDFFPCSSSGSSDDDLGGGAANSDSDEPAPFSLDTRSTDLVVGLDLSGLDNENGCCHLNSVLVALFSCRTFRRFFGPDVSFPQAEGEVWRHLIDLRCQMGTLITQSTLDLQFVLSQAPEFHHYFERWQDACETLERIVHILSRTEFGADLIPLMSMTTLRYTRHACSMDPYPSTIEEEYIAVSETKLIESWGKQSFGHFLRTSAEKEGISLESCPCCHEPAEVHYLNQLLVVPQVLVIRIIRDWDLDGQDVQLRPVPVPIEFCFEEFHQDYRLSAAVCVQGSAAYHGHYYTIVRTESNDWYVYDDARVKALGGAGDVQQVTDTIYFCIFERL